VPDTTAITTVMMLHTCPAYPRRRSSPYAVLPRRRLA
jgi:hypothetical protein